MKNIANSVSIAVQNAEAFKKIENQKNEIQIKNKSLEQIKDSLEHKVAERTAELEKINKEMKFLSIVATQTDNAVMIMDADGNILWINDCFTRIYEYDYDSFIKVRGNNIRQTSFNPDISDSIEKCIREKVPVYYDAPNVKLNGETIWTQTTLTPVLDGNGNIKNLVTIDSDITDIKVAEAKTIRTNRDLTDSIRYAYKIQSVLLPKKSILDDAFPENFILFKPKNIVSGDFYWFKRESDKIMIVAADCTGHGVPGAFMSILGITFLNETAESIYDLDKVGTAEILENLRYKIKNVMRQNDENIETRDGMDVSLCIIDLKTLQMKFSGANNSAFVVSKSGCNQIKADRIPIGVLGKNDLPFTENSVQLCHGDTLYLISDGYCDQLGAKGRFKTHNFKTLLLSLYDKSMTEQNNILLETLDQHRIDVDGVSLTEQTDDILIMGMKI